MTIEEALEITQSVLEQGRLNKIQEIVFRQAWQGQSYQEIATSAGYEVGYVTDVGSKLWQLLSKAFNRKVTKYNLQGVLKQMYAAKHTAKETPAVFIEAWLQAAAEEKTAQRYWKWGEVVDTSVCYGRTAELAALKQWIVQDCCRLVTILGMGGIGKTTLAARAVEEVQDEFKFLIWRSLRNAPPVTEFVKEMILFFSNQQEVDPLRTLESQIACLMENLRHHRCLLVLDNGESILRSGERAGRYRPGYEPYGQLLRRIADERHQSCLILTSREKPIGLAAKEGETLPVRSFQLAGLQMLAAQQVLKAKGLVAAEAEFSKLIEYYAGNPLVLKIAATTIQSLFDGEIYKFLEHGIGVYGDIWELVDQQFNRLTTLEQQLMHQLAKNPKWMTLSNLFKEAKPEISYRELLEALESLQKRSLIQKNGAKFIQQPMIREYVAGLADIYSNPI